MAWLVPAYSFVVWNVRNLNCPKGQRSMADLSNPAGESVADWPLPNLSVAQRSDPAVEWRVTRSPALFLNQETI